MSSTLSPAIPARAAGIGLKAQHYKEALDSRHEIDFFEVHAENFMGAGGPPHRWLEAVRSRFPLSMHGVCLSVGGRDDLDRAHLDRLKRLVDRYQPALVSEHIAWSSDGGFFFNDLLPPPMTEASLNRTCAHVDQIQARLARQILIENPSHYINFDCNDIPEPTFLNEITRRTGCGLLLDVNNVFVSAFNTGFDAFEYIDSIDADIVKEIHLAGHAIDHYDDITLRVDNHGDHVCREVFDLYEHLLRRVGPKPTLVEWDTDIPSFDTLTAETAQAKQILTNAGTWDDANDAA